MKKLPLTFYQQDTTKVACELLGKKLVHKKNNQITSGIIIETEAYLGIEDPACHTFEGRKTPKVASMYKHGGHAYVYFIYGIHFCFNVVTENEHKPEAVLIRALFPVEGINLMRQRRKFNESRPNKDLCSGPGKLAQAMAFDRSTDGVLLTSSELWIEEEISFSAVEKNIITSERVGIDYAGDAKFWPLRFSFQMPV